MSMENLKKYLPEDINPEINRDNVSFKITPSTLKEVISDFVFVKKLSLKLMTATDERNEHGVFKIWYVFSVPGNKHFIIPYLELTDTTEFPSLALSVNQLWHYEKLVHTFFGLTPVGHPDLRPITLHENWPENIYPLRKDFLWNTRPAEANLSYTFETVAGEGIYEIPVGPIHAGIIEPGHFRFSVAGENIVALEPRLGFTHKGSEKMFELFSLPDQLRLSEKISGDSSFSHSLAFALAIEKLANLKVPKRAEFLRVIFAELERLANHFGDLGAIMMDAGFNFGGSQGSRLREMIMQINESLTASRFLRGVNAIGGVTKDINEVTNKKLVSTLNRIRQDYSEVLAIAENSMSLLNRLKGTGLLAREIALNQGVTGVPARAVGIATDTRVDYPYSSYQELFTGPIAIENEGDVYARFQVRSVEIFSSLKIIMTALTMMPSGEIVKILTTPLQFNKNDCAVSQVEGWRGEIVYFITTDTTGKISRVFPRDPSMINWSVLKDVCLDNVVPDFPLINKSFNLSYTGNDL